MLFNSLHTPELRCIAEALTRIPDNKRTTEDAAILDAVRTEIKRRTVTADPIEEAVRLAKEAFLEDEQSQWRFDEINKLRTKSMLSLLKQIEEAVCADTPAVSMLKEGVTDAQRALVNEVIHTRMNNAVQLYCALYLDR